jgi:hypothetical protein
MLKSLFWSLAVSLCFVESAHAASFDLKPASLTLQTDQAGSVEVYLNSPEGPINTVAGQLVYDQEKFAEISISDGGTVVGAWIEKPTAKDGRISFAALIPGGAGEGRLFILKFKAAKPGQGRIQLESGTAFLNDGNGTTLKISQQETFIEVNELVDGQAVSEAAPEPSDTNPPQPLTLRAAHDPLMFDDKWFIVFNATDAESGIAGYEVAEQPKGAREITGWQAVSSPYVLQDQSRQARVFVKAVDNQGNYWIATLEPENTPNQNLWQWLIYAIILFVMIGIFLWRKKQNAKSTI